MAVAANDRISGPFECTGGETVIPYDFKIRDAADLAVWRRRGGADARLTLNIDYAVTGVGNSGGGNVVLAEQALAGDRMLVAGDRVRQRALDLVETRAWLAPALNSEWDSLQIQIQELRSDLDRTLKRSRFDGAADPTDNEMPSGRIGYLYMDSDGNLTIVPGNGGGSGGGVDVPLAVEQGGTGGTTAAEARSNLGLGALATKSLVGVVDIASGVVRMDVESNIVSAPPGSPTVGQMWLVPAGATGAWAGHATQLAIRTGGGWSFQTPAGGWQVYAKATEQTLIYTPTNGWSVMATATALGHLKYAEFEDQRPNGVLAEAAVINAWTRRGINTPVANTIPGCSLALNVLTIPAGVYMITHQSSMSSTGASQTRLKSLTTSKALTSNVVHIASGVGQNVVHSGILALTEAEDFALEYLAVVNPGAGALGASQTSLNETERYASVKILDLRSIAGLPGVTLPDISGLVSIVELDEAADLLVAYDTSDGAHKKLAPNKLTYRAPGGVIRTTASRLAETVYVSDYGGDLAAAVTAIGSQSRTLVVNDDCTFGANLSIPSNIELRCRKRCRIYDSGFSLTVNGPFEAGKYKVFDGFSAGDVTFTWLEETLPEWWGALANGGDDTVPIQCAIDALAGSTGGCVKLRAKIYNATQPLVVSKSYVGIRGRSKTGTRIMRSGAMTDGIRFLGSWTQTIANNYIENLYIARTTGGTGGTGIWFFRCANPMIRNVHSADFLFAFGQLRSTNLVAESLLGSYTVGSAVGARGWDLDCSQPYTVSISIASPGVVTSTAHGLPNGTAVIMETSGALPTGLAPDTVYYIVNATTNTYQLANTIGGAAINTSGSQSGTHKLVAGGPGGNASSVYRDILFEFRGSTGGGTYGFHVTGAYISDLIFDACDFASADTGWLFDCTNSFIAGNEDVQLFNPRSDYFSVAGIDILNATGEAMINIVGGWMDHKNLSPHAAAYGIRIRNSRGVRVSDCQFYGHLNNASQSRGIFVQNSQQIAISGNTLKTMARPIVLDNVSYSVVDGNQIWNDAINPAVNMIEVSGGGTGVALSKNMLDGYATTGIDIASGVTTAILSANVANPANITTVIADAGTGTKYDKNVGFGTDAQILGAELAALKGLVSAANKIGYFTGPGAAALTDFLAASVTAYTPTITSTGGALTTTTINRASYFRIGKLVVAIVGVTVNAVGTATGAMKITLPVTPAAAGQYIGAAVGREVVASGVLLGGSVENSAGGFMLVGKYDGGNWMANSAECIAVAVYVAA